LWKQPNVIVNLPLGMMELCHYGDYRDARMVEMISGQGVTGALWRQKN